MHYKVVVECVVFNHAAYLRDCLDGFLAQETDFDFVVVIHDDASTDSSRQVIEEYATLYPKLFIPVYEKTNQYSLGSPNFSGVLDKAVAPYQSDYFAICEGDDYWIDSQKLQKQVDFLDSHPDYSICFHKAIEHWEDHSLPDSNYCGLEGREYALKEIFQVLTIPTASALIRRRIFEDDYWKTVSSSIQTHFRDNMIWYCCAQAGRMMCLDFFGSVYRRQTTGIAYSVSPTTHMRNNYEYFKVMKKEDKYLARNQILYDIPQLLLDSRHEKAFRKEISQIAFSIGLCHTAYACIVYYFKKLARGILFQRVWDKLKSSRSCC